MKRIALSLLLLTNSAWSYDSMESEKHLYAYHAFTKELQSFFIEFPETETESAILDQLKFDLYKCGISSTMETCLDSELKTIKSLKTFQKEDELGVRYLVKGITKKLYDNFNIFQVMTIHYEGDIIIDKVEYFQVEDVYSESDFQKFFDLYTTNSLTPVMEFNDFLPKDPESYLMEGEISETPEKILHVLQYALKLDDSEENKTKVAEILKQKTDVLKELKNPSYQEEYLFFLEDLKVLDDSIALSYLESPEEVVRMKAAIVLSMKGIKEPAPIHDLVVKGLVFHDYKVQLRALDGIYKIKDGLQDDILIMNMMLDGHAEVSEKAYHLSLALELTNDHIPHIKLLLGNDNPAFISLLFDILNKIESPAAKSIFINYLDDNSPEITQKAFKFLKPKELTPAEINAIYEHLDNIRPHTKFYSLQILDAKDKTERATKAMIDALTDITPKVRDLSALLLDKREDITNMKNALIEKVGKKRSRLLAIKLLNRFTTPDVTNTFIKNLKNLDKEEMAGVFTLLKSRDFTGSEFKTLTRSYYTTKEAARDFIIKLLTKIPEQRTLNFLYKIDNFERDEAVKKTIETLKKHLEDTLSAN